MSELIAARAQVPRLGNQLHLREQRILPQELEERTDVVGLMQLATERRRKIEAKAVDVHFGRPIAERIHHHLERTRMAHVQRVAATGDVNVITWVILLEPVVSGVVDAAEGQHRAVLVAFRRVVVDDVEDHLEARLVQRFDHRLEFADGILYRIARVRREVTNRVVAPIVAQPPLDQRPLVDERMHRQQLDRGHAESPQVIDDRRRGESGIGAA